MASSLVLPVGFGMLHCNIIYSNNGTQVAIIHRILYSDFQLDEVICMTMDNITI